VRTRRLPAALAALLACQAAHATRQDYWDFMWLTRVASVCWAQSSAHREAPLAKLFAGMGTGNWAEFDRRPSTECLKRLDRMPEHVCIAVTNLDESALEAGRIEALRKEHDAQAWRAEQAMEYLEKMGLEGRDVPCPDTKPEPPSGNPPLDERTAACVKPTQAPPRQDGGRLLRMSTTEVAKLAEEGDPLAQNEMGRRFGLGDWVAKSSTTSADWYRRAAEQGLDIAQANLAYMYLHGEGVPRDPALALQWAGRSAAQGSAVGQLTLGYMYGTGIGVPKDGAQAERCYLLAANQGDTRAQQTLARIYGRGEGVPVDKDLSVLWFQRARQSARTGRPWTEQSGDLR
jgi:hypothetical protein